MDKIFAIISGLLALAATPPYIVDILKKTTKPQRMTWFIFTTLSTIALISQRDLGASWSLVFLALDALASLVVLILSFSYGVGGYTKMDMVALTVAFVGVTISILEGRPLIALCGVILADLSGAALTILKTYKKPSSETSVSWLLFGSASIFGALAVGKIEADLLIYPLYIALICFSIPATQLISRKYKRNLTAK